MNTDFKVTECETFTADIYVAGPLARIEDICQEFVMTGLCVSVTACSFVYTGGKEFGARVTLINYPRFPSEPATIFGTALMLAKTLVEKLFQGSATVVTSSGSVFISRRKE